MEKKLKLVRGNILTVIVLLIIANISTIISPIEDFDVLYIFLERVLPLIYIIGYIISYIMYKKDIITGAKIEMFLAILMIIVVTLNIIAIVLLTQSFTFLSLTIQIAFGYLIPIILLVDAISIRKLANE